MRSSRSSLQFHKFGHKLLLNQWLISQFGICPLTEHTLRGKTIHPFQLLVDAIKDPSMEGIGEENVHQFHQVLTNHGLLDNDDCSIDSASLMRYEENIVRHTHVINENRSLPVVWKYYQWLALLFVEVYLDRFFADRRELLDELNVFLERFNSQHPSYHPVPPYRIEDLNKLCLQCATGSGKTLLMHVNMMQYVSYATSHGENVAGTSWILLTPNERLSQQHIEAFGQSGIPAKSLLEAHPDLWGADGLLGAVSVLEITKMGDKAGPRTIASKSLGNSNLLLVDEGHRGLSSSEEGVWYSRRAELCSNGFAFEYSATFEQAARASGSDELENGYAKSIVFDYSYRWFYGDGFGKDYHILNLATPTIDTRTTYLTGCLLKYYQQLRLYESMQHKLARFNLEKPLLVFVGNTVAGKKSTRDQEYMISDVANIVHFIADCLTSPDEAIGRIAQVLHPKTDGGLIDEEGKNPFSNGFTYLSQIIGNGESIETMYADMLDKMFNCVGGGDLELRQIGGRTGEIALYSGGSTEPFGLINVGDSKQLCDHLEETSSVHSTGLKVVKSDFTDPMFESIKSSESPVNILIGSKKFVEGWDCWRVSTLGLMHVGRTEGAQIIQLFGRGVRLKGYDWSLKRSSHTPQASVRPKHIEELETLNVFGVRATFMDRFRQFLRESGLPGNERRETITVPLNVTYDFGKALRIIRPKISTLHGREYDFKRDGASPTIGDLPEYIRHNPIVCDWYSKVQVETAPELIRNKQGAVKHQSTLSERDLVLLDYDRLYLEMESYKQRRAWSNLSVTVGGIRKLFQSREWYSLYLPEQYSTLRRYSDIQIIQDVALELLKRYAGHLYSYYMREYYETRMEVQQLAQDDGNIPTDTYYHIIVDGGEEELIRDIRSIADKLAQGDSAILNVADMQVCNFGKHLFRPLFYVQDNQKIMVKPVILNASEFQFICDLKRWYDAPHCILKERKGELFVLRNMSRGRGVGFFEAGNFHPDFIMWALVDEMQYITFVEPHGMIYEGPESNKVQFYQQIKSIERRLGDDRIILNSFICSTTPYLKLSRWNRTQEELEKMHILFMDDGTLGYIDKLFAGLLNSRDGK